MQKVWAKIAKLVLAGFLLMMSAASVAGATYAFSQDESTMVDGKILLATGDEDGGTTTPTPPGSASGDKTSILPENWGISDILKLVLNIVVYGLGVAAVLGVIIAGILYMTARDNEAQVTKAKTRLFEVVIGLVAWAVMYAVLNWLIPGGLNLDAVEDGTKGTGTGYMIELDRRDSLAANENDTVV